MSGVKHILIIGTVWPEPKSSAAGSRMLQLINAFKQHQYKITFACAAAKGEFSLNTQSLGINEQVIELNNSSFDEFIKTLNPDIVMFDRFMIEEQYGWRVKENCPDALKILDTEDLHCLRQARTLRLKNPDLSIDKSLTNNIALREIASIYRCDLSLIISQYEMELLQSFYSVPGYLLLYIPFMFDKIADSDIRQLPDFESRTHFVSIGNFLHEPNRNAVLYLKEVIWPLIRQQLPEVEIHVYGAYATQQILQLNNLKEGFIIKGRAEDANEVVKQSRVSIAPLRMGAGLKGKLAESMMNGTPSVTTKIGAEGMHDNLEWNGYITDDPDEFANHAIELYINKNTWEQKQLNGFAIINNLFNKTVHTGKLFAVLDHVSTNLTSHRLKNFNGLMLNHHTMQSTKFMSRWIEEKNKMKP